MNLCRFKCLMTCVSVFFLTFCSFLQSNGNAQCTEKEIWSVFVGSKELGDVNDQLLTEQASPEKDCKQTFNRIWSVGSASRSVSIGLTIYKTAQDARDAVEKYGKGGSGIVPVSPKIGDAGYWTNSTTRPYYLICRKNVTISFFSRFARSGYVGPQDKYLRLMVDRLDQLGCVPTVCQQKNHVITVLKPLECSPNPAKAGERVNCSVSAADSQGHSLNHTWSCPGGNFEKNSSGGSTTTWVAPANKTAQVKAYEITATIACKKNLNVQSTFKQFVSPDNRVIRITGGPRGDPNPAASKQNVTCAVQAAHPDGLPLTYKWRAGQGAFILSDPKSPKWVWQAPENTTGMIIDSSIEVTITSSDGLQAKGAYIQKVLGQNMLDLSILNRADLEQRKFLTGRKLTIKGKLTHAGKPVFRADIGMVLKPQTMNAILHAGAVTASDGSFTIVYEVPRFRENEMPKPEDWTISLTARPIEKEMGTATAEVKVHIVPLYFQLKSVRLVQVVEAPLINGKRFLAADKGAALRVYISCSNLEGIDEKYFPELKIALDVGYGKTDILKMPTTFQLKKRLGFAVGHSLKPLDLMIPPLKAHPQGPLLIGALVDPDFIYTDPKDSKGMFQGISAQVKKMKHLSLRFIPIDIPTGQGKDYWNNQELSKFLAYCRLQEKFIRQTYPLPTSHIHVRKTWKTYNPWKGAFKPFPKWQGARIAALLTRLGLEAKLEGRILVGVLPNDNFWFENPHISGNATGYIPAAVVRFERTIRNKDYFEPDGLTAHEVGHVYDLNMGTEEYDAYPESSPITMENGSQTTFGGKKIRGLIMKEGRVYDLNDNNDFVHAFPYPVEMDHALCFMGSVPNRGEARGPFYAQWICKETYIALFKALMDPPGEPMLYVSGFIKADGTATLNHIYEIIEEAGIEYGGDYIIEGLSSRGDVLSKVSFNAHPGKNQIFGVTLPGHREITKLALKYRGSVKAEKSRSTNKPAVTLLAPNGGESIGPTMHIRWSASDADNDPLVYSVLYSNDDGKSWKTLVAELDKTAYDIPSDSLPGGHMCRLKIIASDGFNTSQDISDNVFSVPHLKPMALISSPQKGDVYHTNEKILLKAVFFDPEDQTDGGVSFHWTSNIQGELGRGKDLAVSSLKAGRHVISVRIMNTSGEAAAANVPVIVTEVNVPVTNDQKKPSVTLLCTTPNPIEGQPVGFAATASDQNPQDKLTYQWYLNGQPVRWAGLYPKWRNAERGVHNVAIRVSDGKEVVRKDVTFTVSEAFAPAPSVGPMINQALLLNSIPPSPWNRTNVFSSGKSIYLWVETKILNKPHELTIIWISPSGREIKRESFDVHGWGAKETFWSEFQTGHQTMKGRWEIRILVDGKTDRSLYPVLEP